jgi:hypothetical protein
MSKYCVLDKRRWFVLDASGYRLNEMEKAAETD